MTSAAPTSTANGASGSLKGVIAAPTAICTIDGVEGRLIYRGYSIEELTAGATFEEVVYLLSGEGTLQLALDTKSLRAGDLVVVPRNTPHAFTPTGSRPAVVLQFFTPRFVDGDRVVEVPVK